MEGKHFYDEDIDDLMISVKGEGERVRKNYMFGDFVVSTTGKGKIAGLEIRNVSHFLEDSGVSISILKKIESAGISIVSKNGAIGIYVILKLNANAQFKERKLPVTHIPSEAIAC